MTSPLPPLWQDVATCALMLWPLGVVLRRVGLPRWWAGLIFASVLLPYAGHVMLALLLALHPWPRLSVPEVVRRAA